MLNAIRAHDYSTVGALALALPRKLDVNTSMPAWAGKYLPFAAELASAKDSDSVQKALENAAAPIGSYRAKRGYRAGHDFTLTLTALPGLQGGEEWLVGRSIPGAGASPQAGMFAPIGLDFEWGVCDASSIGFFLLAIDLGALVNFRTDTSAGSTTVDSQPTVGVAQVVSPGLFLTYGIGGTPLVMGVGGYPFTSPGLKIEDEEVRRFRPRGRDVA
jgi:hypothetical protein